MRSKESGREAGMIGIIHKNFKKVLIGNEKKIIDHTVNDRKKRRSMVTMGIGIIIAAMSILVPESAVRPVFGKDAEMIKISGLILAICVSINGLVILILRGLLYVSEKCGNSAIYLAAKQNLYNFKKVKSIISSIIIAVALFVGFQGLYASIRETTRKYVKESVNYEKLILFDTLPQMEEGKLCSLLSSLKGKNSRYCITLTAILKDDNDHYLTLTGIDLSYYQMQYFYIADGSDINRIYENSIELQVMFSSKVVADRKWNIGKIVSQYKYKGSRLQFQIGALYDPISLNQAFTSKTQLSKRLYGVDNKYNAIYLYGYSDQSIDELMSHFTHEKYKINDMKKYAQECVDQATNGTEMIEVILYVSMFFVASLVINLLILSYGDRKKQYTELQILGIRKEILLKSMLIESGMIYLLGAVLGFALAVPCIKALLCMVHEELIFDTALYIPYGLSFGMMTLCFVMIIIFTYIIGAYSLKSVNLDKHDSENEGAKIV